MGAAINNRMKQVVRTPLFRMRVVEEQQPQDDVIVRLVWSCPTCGEDWCDAAAQDEVEDTRDSCRHCGHADIEACIEKIG